jgi:hypothetical protein
MKDFFKMWAVFIIAAIIAPFAALYEFLKEKFGPVV